MAGKPRPKKLTRDRFMAVQCGDETFLFCLACGRNEGPIGRLGSAWGIEELDQQIDLHIWAHETSERHGVPVAEFDKEHRAHLARLWKQGRTAYA
jgi:hypothetical protein